MSIRQPQSRIQRDQTVKEFDSRLPIRLLALGLLLGLLLALTLITIPSRAATPGLPGSGLAPSTYSENTAYHLRNAKIVWVNQDYYKERGVDVSSATELEKLKTSIDSQFSFLIPTAKTPRSLFDSVQRIFFPDKYGGPGLNGNLGSGRAASINDLQLKGLGPTDMVGEKADLDHISGGVGATQAIAEAIWSEILNREAPFGSNRVVALIDTGLYEPIKGGIAQPRYLVVREDPLRPAHFIANPSEMSAERRAADDVRVKENQKRLHEIMMTFHVEHGDASMDAMFLVFARKVAAQWAYLHANLLHHGAVSPSNIEINGKMLDLSTMTTLPGAMLAMGHDPVPFGDSTVIDKYLMKPFYDAIAANPEVGLTLSYEAVQSYLAKSYATLYKIEILKLTGLPEQLAKQVSALESSKKIFAHIETLRNAGYSERLKTKAFVPEQKGKYDVGAILARLARQSRDVAESRISPDSLSDLIDDPALRDTLVKDFGRYYVDVYTSAKTLGYKDLQLADLIRKTAAERNRDRTALRRNLRTYLSKAVRSFVHRLSLVNLQSFIDRQIDGQRMPSPDPQKTNIFHIEEEKMIRQGPSCRDIFGT